MTIHDVDWTLPMTLDLISETQRFDVMPVDGPKVHVIMLKDDGPNAVELWKGMLRVDQMVDVLNWMQFMRILVEGKDD